MTRERLLALDLLLNAICSLADWTPDRQEAMVASVRRISA